MELSVIIASTRPGYLKNCIGGFAKQSGNFDFEVIAAGDVSGIRFIPKNLNLKLIAVSEEHPNVKRNRAAELASGALIAMMDDDAIPGEHWVEQAITFARRHPGCVITGPELPYPNADEFSVLSHKILSSSAAEFTKGHVNTEFETVSWYDVPFCNCVFPKELWLQRRGFDENILWHMDDFHFFFPLRNKVSFINNPAMQIHHNRYPESLMKLAKYKWRIRSETGEKIIKHSDIYWSVAPVKYAVITSLLAAVFLILLLVYKPLFILVLAAVYFLLAIAIVVKVAEFKPKNVFNGLLILVTVHFISMAALYFGMVKASFIRQKT